MAQPPNGAKRFTFSSEYVNCGKPSCRVCGGNTFAHGPYWYAFYTKANGKTGKVYIGLDPVTWCTTFKISPDGVQRA